MSPFESSVFGKPLEAEEKAKEPQKSFRNWVSQKIEDIKCVFRRK